ncbi:MAG: hypothetical protein KDB03_07300 [Planctomycetales bacterium]|nr:hypothetical protein [Planctomycetales bacterium]
MGRGFDATANSLAVAFCAALPEVYGDVNQVNMWNEVATAIQSGIAITRNMDLFIQHVLDSIHADKAEVEACDPLKAVMKELQSLNAHERHAWLQYLAKHLIPVLVCARSKQKGQNRS